MNHVTLTDDFKIWGQTSSTWPFITRLVIMLQSWSWCRIWHFCGQGSQKTEINHLTLTVWRLIFKLKVMNIYYHDLPYLWLYIYIYIVKQDLGVDSNFLKVKDLEKNKTIYLTLTVDLELHSQTHFHMIFLIFGSYKIHTWTWCRF